MRHDVDTDLPELRVDGGMVANNFLMQFQADIIGRPVLRPEVPETTALGAAYLAGLAVGFWDSLDDLRANWHLDRQFNPSMGEADRAASYRGWQRAVKAALVWAEDRE
jgi:glycerol kinase